MSTDNKDSPLKRFDFKSFGGARPAFVAHLSADHDQPEPEKKFTDADLEKAKKESFDEGIKEGLKQANEQIQKQQLEIDKQIISLVEKLTSQFKELLSIMQKRNQSIETQFIRLATEIARKVSGKALEQTHIQSIENTIRSCVSMLAEKEDSFTVFVNPATLPRLQEKLATIEGDIKDKITLKPEESLKPFDCRIEWTDGGAELNTGAIWQEIDKIVNNL